MAADLAELAVDARQEGIDEVLRLLAQPEDLAKLPELLADFTSKSQANKAALGSLVQSQVEAARRGLDLVDKAHRHVLKLRSSIDSIHRLCAECASLIDHQDKIQVLSQTHANLQSLLTELKDIVDLPDRAETLLELLDDPANILPVYEALTVLEATAEKAKAAWNRNVKAGKHDMTSMMQYLQRVSDVMARFEARFWEHMASYEQLARDRPSLLVDCASIIEMQERLDKQSQKLKIESLRVKRFRVKLSDMLAKGVSDKFQFLLDEAPKCGECNKTVKYSQEGDVVTDEQHDYLGQLTSLTLMDATTGETYTLSTEAELRKIEIISEEVFDEKEYLDAVLDELYECEADLAATYDFVMPCFPPHFNIFDNIFQLYHVQVATVIDTIGQRAKGLSTQGSLRMMEFVRKYMTTLRGLGVDEQLVRLPVSPSTDPDTPPGLDLLVSSYISKMEKTVSTWYTNIMVVDLEYEPKPGPNGKLRTSGVTDFFRIMNEEMEVIRSINDHGKVMFNTAQTALKIMKGFQAEQTRVISDPDLRLSFEMFCALTNNNVECHDQSLEFVEEVQEQLDEEFQGQLQEVEDVCRGFLEVAKIAVVRAVVVMFNDPGMTTQLIAMYSKPEWLSGQASATLLATIKDYMGDVQTFVEASFVKRVAEAALEELGRRAVNMFTAGVVQVTDAMVERMQADEALLEAYFKDFLKPDRLHRLMLTFTHLRTLISCPTVPDVVEAYRELSSTQSVMTFDAVTRILETRGTYGQWERKQCKDALAQCKEIWRVLTEAAKKKAEAKGGKVEEAARGSFFASWGWGK